MPICLALLAIAVAAGVVGYLLVNKGMTALRSTSVVPTHAVQSLKEDAKWTTRQGA